MLLDQSVALVTGAGRAIGKEIALRMASEGASVVLASRSVDDMENVANQIRDLGRRALVVPMDLRDGSTIDEAAKRVREEFGRIDILVNNSGLAGPSKPICEIEPDEWEETFRVNVTGAYLCCRAFLPEMLEAGKGSVIFIGSVTGKRPLVNRTPYASSKMALVGLMRTLAMEVGGAGIRVNLISPGPVAGERLDWVLEQQARARDVSVQQARDDFSNAAALKRVVAAEEVANAAVFLASSYATGITGEDLNVSAGLAMY